jgi:hypothetical protein
MAWHTAATARERWPDAARDDNMLNEYLEVAKIQVLAYAPALAEGAEIPVHYRMAQLMQARAIWAATVKNSEGQLDAGGYAIPAPHPLDWSVTQMLRPRTGVPFVG